MKLIITMCLILSYVFSSPPEEFENEKYQAGELVFDNKCSSCHVKSMDIQVLMSNFIEHDNKVLNLLAPTGNEISFRLKSQIGSKDDVEFHIEEVTDFVKDYIINPDKAKTVCLEGVVKHFDTMPSMKGKVSEEEMVQMK